MKNILRIIVIVSGLLLIGNFPNTSAQNNELGDKIQKIKLEKLLNKLDLDESTSKVFVEKYKEFSKEIKTLNKKRFKTYKLVSENLESGNGLDTLVDQLISLEK
jgi:hypothetical protein